MIPPEWLTLAVAEGMFLLARGQDIVVAAKNDVQRSVAEQERVRHGLFRSLILEFLLFVPVSAFMVLVTLRYMLPNEWMASPAAYGLLGMVSYAFPFMSFKEMVTRWALHSLKGFYDALSPAERAELDRQTHSEAVESRTTGVGGGT
jgi:hypothetical protein